MKGWKVPSPLPSKTLTVLEPKFATAKSETLCTGRFTAADIVIGYALRLADSIGLAKDFGPNVAAYWGRLQQRNGYKRAVAAEQRAGIEQNIAPRVRE